MLSFVIHEYEVRRVDILEKIHSAYRFSSSGDTHDDGIAEAAVVRSVGQIPAHGRMTNKEAVEQRGQNCSIAETPSVGHGSAVRLSDARPSSVPAARDEHGVDRSTTCAMMLAK
ncbi:hypothetical protein ACFP2T_00015 [Plantactinospora solaniradicis]|uniref:Uncharacterized protein n=1 Tax=Plantactinospora solaniradicis TaxID=1723736 RepID=A0ABW1K1L4_9ACTN